MMGLECMLSLRERIRYKEALQMRLATQTATFHLTILCCSMALLHAFPTAYLPML